jgi:hypothetical protein
MMSMIRQFTTDATVTGRRVARYATTGLLSLLAVAALSGTAHASSAGSADPGTPATVTSSKPLALAFGVHPELNGRRLQGVGDPKVYLVLDGKRRWIPNPTTYTNLFRDWNGIQQVIDINAIDDGGPLSDGAVLMRPANQAPVYLVTDGSKRWVTAPSVMDKYYFDWNKVVSVPPVVAASVPTGVNIN